MATYSHRKSNIGRASASGFLSSFDKRHEALAKRQHESSMQYNKQLHEEKMLRMKLEAEKERAKYCSCNKKRKNYKRS